VRGADLEAREAIERALEDEVRERERGFERVADGVVQAAVAAQARLQLRGPDRMDEHQHTQLLGLAPERMELRVRQLLAVHAAAAGKPQCACTSTVFTLRPLTTTWRRRGVCALACGNSEQPMNAIPPFTKFLRVVICFFSQIRALTPILRWHRPMAT